MCKKILIAVILIVLIVSGSVAAKEVLSAKIELKDGSVIKVEIPIILVKTKDGKFIKVEDIVSIRFFTETPSIHSTAPVAIKSDDSTWNLQNPLILVYVTVGQRVKGINEKLWEGLLKILKMNIWGHPSPVFEEKDMQRLTSSHTIFLIHSKNLKYLAELEAKHPELLPLPCSKLESFSFPLFYFSRNAETDRIRGVIIADEVTPSLAKLLTEDVLPLDIPVLLEYENGQLKKK